MRNIIQIAGVIDAEEARMLVSAGVDYIGFPLRLAVHAQDTTEEEAAQIVRDAGIAGRSVVITYEERPEEVVALCDALGVSMVQLHGDIPVAKLRRIKEFRPELFCIKSLIVRGGNLEELLEFARQYEPYADAFITDTFDPDTGACGATGKTHDWQVSAALARELSRPLILAGGLKPGNVRAGIEAVRPAGVDAHTGVEGPDGRKDERLVRQFVEESRRGFAGE